MGHREGFRGLCGHDTPGHDKLSAILERLDKQGTAGGSQSPFQIHKQDQRPTHQGAKQQDLFTTSIVTPIAA